jgi:flagellar basal body-associated protein FliL
VVSEACLKSDYRGTAELPGPAALRKEWRLLLLLMLLLVVVAAAAVAAAAWWWSAVDGENIYDCAKANSGPMS